MHDLTSATCNEGVWQVATMAVNCPGRRPGPPPPPSPASSGGLSTGVGCLWAAGWRRLLAWESVCTCVRGGSSAAKAASGAAKPLLVAASTATAAPNGNTAPVDLQSCPLAIGIGRTLKQ